MDKYIYLDREKAKEGVSLVFAVEERALKDYQTYFEGKAIEFVGEDLPHYITYVKDGGKETVQEATRLELCQRGIIKLSPSETVLDGNITEKDRCQLIAEGIITLETEKDKARFERKLYLQAIDLYDKSVLRGDIYETEKQKEIRDYYRQSWLDLPSQYNDVNVAIESLYPPIPDFINYFL